MSSYIRNVALIGGTGSLGSHILKHLLATGKHNVTVLTRTQSKATFPTNPNLKIAKVDYSSEQSIVEALRGNDFLAITLNSQAPRTLHSEIINAAKKAGVPTVLPNYFGFGIRERAGNLASCPIMGSFSKILKEVEDVEGVDYIALVCGFWYEFSLSLGEQWYGFDLKKRTVTFYDDGTRKINTSTWDQCGRAVAALLSLPLTKEGGNAAIQDYLNNGLYIASFLVSQRDMLDSLNRVLGTTDADWKISYEPVEERHRKGLEELGSGNGLGFVKAMYARGFFASGEGDYQTGHVLDNEKLGLPKEDLDEATRRAVAMSQKSFEYEV
ncbi:NAD(P)-binding protein [Cucurbitaria berberidis CBS 394.84]|uniref:NAD(P)-binding protein n=1 Tax=Cucurbitaria berberidis CBS 394.84 TaxID=1168544 RepID=A0A9P4GR24_9PLEO|nr:NAD(P)-binding protein [Cucurbitaria berberidis CBS 394.84]KAF1850155.1 NAD(P)-binding protein [Cucurbitaria berberidis CBS 394.84]